MAKAKQLPSGNWRVQVIAGKVNGKNKYESITRPTEKEANYAALEYELHRKSIARNPTNMTLDEAMTRYIESKDAVLSPSTIADYKKLKRNTLQSLINVRLNRITQEMIQKEINEMAKTHSVKYVYNAHGLLSAVLKEYHPHFRLTTTLPQKQPYTANIPSKTETEIILNAIKNTDLELPVILALWQGMRMSEIRGLTWNALKGDVLHIKQAIVDVDNKPVVKTTKTAASNRKIVLPPYILTLINAQPKDSPYIITLSGTAIYKRFSRLCKNAGLPHFRFHDLRHANASVMLALNIPDKYAQERGGWATNNTLKNVYQQTITDERKIVDAKVDNYFESLLSHEISHDKT